MRRFWSWLLRVTAILAAIAIACLAFVVWQFNQPPFDLARLDHLRPGMTQHHVRQLLGSPSSVYEDSWAYSAFMAWPIVYVYFDDSGAYVSHRYDH
jgi:hypothetical protein